MSARQRFLLTQLGVILNTIIHAEAGGCLHEAQLEWVEPAPPPGEPGEPGEPGQ